MLLTYHVTSGWGMPLAAHSNLTGLPSLHSLLLSLREKMGDSARPVKPGHCINHHKNY